MPLLEVKAINTILLPTQAHSKRVTMAAPTLRLGSEGFEVSKQGFGCMPISPEDEMISLTHTAVSKGITFLHLEGVYGRLTNEILVGKATEGIMFVTVGGGEIPGNPPCCEGSAGKLDEDCIELYYQHGVDTGLPIEVTVGEMKKLVKEEEIKYIGLPEASASTIRRTHAVHPITAVQIEWSLWSRDVEEEITPTCRDLSIGIWIYSSLGRGFLPSRASFVQNLEDNDRRKLFLHQREEIKKLVEDGKIKYIGLSKAFASTIRKVHVVYPITAVQIKWSLWSIDVEEKIISTCRELGIGFVALNPLGQGFVSSEEKHVQNLEDYDWRKNVPSFFRKVAMHCLDLVCYGRLLPTLLCMALIGMTRASSTKKSLAFIALLILLMAMDASAGYNNTNISDSYSGSHGNSRRYTPNPPNPQP